jgi:hypothetical protein
MPEEFAPVLALLGIFVALHIRKYIKKRKKKNFK